MPRFSVSASGLYVAAGSDEPVYNAAVDTLVWDDTSFIDSMPDYTTMQNSTASSIRYHSIYGPDPMTGGAGFAIGTDGGYDGLGHYLRVGYLGTYQETHTVDTVNTPARVDGQTAFLQAWCRVTMASPLNTTTLAIKWFMWWHDDGLRIEWDTHDHLPGPNYPSPYVFGWQVYDTAATAGQADQPLGPYPVQVFDGSWHRFTYQYKNNTSVGGRDGIARMWVDGTKIIDISASAVGVTPPGGDRPWCAWDDVDALDTQAGHFLRWLGNLTTSTPAFTVDLDQFRWWYPTAGG